MLFINPIELLELQAKPLENLDDETFKRARKRLLAEIDLSDEGLYQHKGRTITKSNCQQAIEAWDDVRKREFYYALATSHRALNDYLALGDEAFFTSFSTDQLCQRIDFVNFVSPFFAYNFDRSLSKALRSGDENLCVSILNAQALINADSVSTAYASTIQELHERIAEVETLRLDIKAKTSRYTATTIHEIVGLVQRHFPVAVINRLPNLYEGDLENIASSINYLQLAIWDQFDMVDVAFALLEHLQQLNIDNADKKTYQDNYALAKKRHEDRVSHAQNAPLLQPWSDLLTELKSVATQIEQKRYAPKDAVAVLERELNVAALNAFPSFANEIRNQLTTAIRSMSLNAWNEQNDILSSLALIRWALQIDGPEETKERLRKDETELIALEQKFKGIYSCYFCDKNANEAGSVLKKTIYKEVSRTFIPRKVQFQYIEMEIPRCSVCEKVHQAGQKQFWLFTGFGILVGVLLGLMIDEHYIIGGILGLGLGLFVGYYTEKNYVAVLHVKLASDASLKHHPMLLQKVAEGWTFSKPSA